MYVPRKWGGNGRVGPVLLLERPAPVAKRHPTQMGTGKYIPNRLIAWLEISNTARAGYRNRQDCNLIGVSRTPGATKEWTTSRSYPPIFLFFSFRVPRGSFSIGGNERKMHVEGGDGLGCGGETKKAEDDGYSSC